MKYPPSIDAYREACDEIRSWMTGWLHQSEFDKLSRKHRPAQRRFFGHTGDTIILNLWGGDQNLELVQEMMRHKLIEVRKSKKGEIEYRAVPE